MIKRIAATNASTAFEVKTKINTNTQTAENTDKQTDSWLQYTVTYI